MFRVILCAWRETDAKRLDAERNRENGRKLVMRIKRVIATVLTFLMLASLSVTASAAMWQGEDYEVSVPEGMVVLTPDTSLLSEDWEKVGILNPEEALKTYEEMSGKANFINEGGKISILLTQKTSSTSQEIFNLSEATEERKASVLDELSQSSAEGITIEKGWLEGAEMPFFWIDIKGEINATTVHERLYGTMLNGYTLVFDSYTEGELSAETIETMESIVKSLHVTNMVNKADFMEQARKDALPTFIILGLLVVMIVGGVIYVILRNKREKKQKAEMTRRISEYHRKSAERGEPTEAAVFVNATEVTFPAIRKFSIYHSYIKNIIQLAFGVVLCVAMIVLAVIYATEWWMILIAVVLAGYYAYKVLTSSMGVEKAQKDIYTRGSSSLARYSFYNNEFRVSGFQSTSLYPYFQILDVREHDGYIYLYYGPDNAYILGKNDFSIGKAEKFVDFINEKRKEK